MFHIMYYNNISVAKEVKSDMARSNGVYVMRVASMLTGMHPQTLRKYERTGLLKPSRSKKLRMYSDENIARLRTIKYLVDDLGLNLAGVRIALDIQEKVAKIKKQVASADLNAERKKKLLKSLNESLMVFGTALKHDME